MLELNWAGHFRHFKKLLGHKNLCLITILIAIEGIRVGDVTKGDTFNVNWNPISLEDTARNSRRFARNSALSWTIDALYNALQQCIEGLGRVLLFLRLYFTEEVVENNT